MSTISSPDIAAQVVARPAGRSGLWVGLALLLTLIALAAGAWALLELRLASERIATLDAGLQRAQMRAEVASGASGQLQTQVRELMDHTTRLDRALAETHAALDKAAAANGNVDFALAEVEYLLIIAEQRLALMQDVSTAEAALRAVEQRLTGLQVPGLDAVRGQVSADLFRLAQMPEIDYSQWIEELGQIAMSAEIFPLQARAKVEAPPVVAASPPAQGWRGFLQAIWHELRGMVVITRSTPGVAELPNEGHFLVQNLLLRIETARLALLRRDTRALHDAAASTSDWLRRWFDGSDPRVSNALERLQALSELDPAAPAPDITSSLETLRALIRERAAPMTPEPVSPTQP